METTLSFRVPVVWWKTDQTFRQLIDFLHSHEAAIDELSLFDDNFVRHAYRPIQEVKRRAALLAQRIEQLHEAGFSSVGINVIHSLGHHDLEHREEELLPFRRMVGQDGCVSNSCFCPTDTTFRQYLHEKFQLMAEANPDFIWVDDDLRMPAHGVPYPCFCNRCIEGFNAFTDNQFDRISLVERLNRPEEKNLRREWTEFCKRSLTTLCADICSAIARTNPRIAVGLMTVGQSHSTYGGQPWARWMQALGAVQGRPGHGFYQDDTPRLLLNKLMDVGRQVRDYPANLRMIAYELESYPYVPLDKSIQSVLNESALSLMLGCTGIAFNCLRLDAGTLADYEPLVRAVALERPTWETLATKIQGMSLVGVWPADHTELMANRMVGPGGWFEEDPVYDIQQCNQLMEMGIPFTPFPEHACVTLLAGKIAEAFSEEALKKMLSRGVLMDTTALEVLWKRGLGELTGVRPRKVTALISGERFTDHPLNGTFTADGRRVHDTSLDTVRTLGATAPGVEELSYLVDVKGQKHGASLTTYTNQLGGKIAVCGYHPWDHLGSTAKRRQLTALLDWLSGERLPVLIAETVRVVPFVRQGEDGTGILVAFWNSSFDPSGPLTIRLRGEFRRMVLLSPTDNNNLPMTAAHGETIIELPSIPAWRTTFIYMQA